MTILRTLLIIIFLVAALAVTVIVLMQEGKSVGLGSMAGGASSGDSYWAKNKKHSLEGKFERWTKITAVIFVLSAFLIMLIPNGKPATQGATTDQATSTEASADKAEGGANVELVTPGETADEAATDETTQNDATTNETEANTSDSQAASN